MDQRPGRLGRPATFVGYFLNSDKIHTNYNAFCYSDPATDAIINEALTLTDQQERKDLYEELNEIALKTNIAAFYATTKLSWGLRKEVHGLCSGEQGSHACLRT